MSEMLGNQYFMARNYPSALRELEPCLVSEPGNKHVKRKLIICYIQTGKVQNAFVLFKEMIKTDIDFIMNADPIKDDCPCPELVENIEIMKIESSLDYHISAGMLWLYCDVDKSIEHFKIAVELDPDNDEIQFAFNTVQEAAHLHDH